MKTYNLRIAWLYPSLMSTYGDRGNVICLQKRSQWRGIECEIVPIEKETPIENLRECDVLFMGGAQDRQQELVNKDLIITKGPVMKQMIERDIPALFVCAAYQFVGVYYKTADGTKLPGLGILDLYTEHQGDQRKRLTGNVTATISGAFDLYTKTKKWPIIDLVGFENHGGRTYLGKNVLPLAHVTGGQGNNGEDMTEGAEYRNVIGSYFHGPLLPKNPHIADWLLAKALEVKYKKKIILSQLDDELELQAHTAAQKYQ